MNFRPPKTGSIYRCFNSWKEAENARSAVANQKLRESLEDQIQLCLRVREGEFAFVRDGTAFDEPEYPFALLALLLRFAMKRNGKLRVIDFGGALGTTYFQTRRFLDFIPSLKWSVVELPDLVAAGQKHFTTAELSFHLSIGDAFVCHGADVVLVSGTLQYVAEPAQIVDEIRNLPIADVVLDRIPIIDADQNQACLQLAQTADSQISWPLRLFSRQRLLELFKPDFESTIEFDSYCDPPEWFENGTVWHKGFALERVQILST